MADDSSDLSVREPPKILVPIAVLEGQTLPETLVDFLVPAYVVLLGYHVVPEQTPAEQASMQFGDRAQAVLDDVARAFRTAGRRVETRLVFTHDRNQTIDRVAEDVGATATLLPNPTGGVEDVLVPLRGAIDVDRLADLVATLLADTGRRVTLWGLTTGDGGYDAEGAVTAARETLGARGLPTEQVTAETAVVENPIRAIVERSAGYDVVVMGEGGDSLLSVLFGDDAERVAEGAVAPVIVVRAERAPQGPR